MPTRKRLSYHSKIINVNAFLPSLHPKWKTPHVITAITGVAVAIAVMILRKTAANQPRAFRTPALWLIGPLTIAGTIFLFLNLPLDAMLVLPIWGLIGLIFYYLYSRNRSHLGRGLIEVHEDDLDPSSPIHD